MAKENRTINLVREGAIDTYCSFRVETDLTYENLCDKIAEKIANVCSNYYNSISKDLSSNIADFIRDKEDSIMVKVNGERVENTLKSETKSNCILGSQSRVTIDSTENGFKINVIPEAVNEFEKQTKVLKSDFETSEELYGNIFVSSHQRVTLPYFDIKLYNGASVRLNATLYIFKNFVCVLRVSLPLIDIDASLLMNSNFNGCIDSSVDVFSIANNNSTDSMEEIIGIYLKMVYEISGVNQLFVNTNNLYNIILCDYDGMPKVVNQLSPNVEEDLYRIIAAPICKIEGYSYEEEASKYIKEHSMGDNQVKYILSTINRCLSIVDKTIIDYNIDKAKEEIGIDSLSKENKSELFKLIINSVRINVEYVFLILMLKKMNNSYSFTKKNDTQDAIKSQTEYNKNKIFIAELQEECYGTVREQLATFEKMMPFYVNGDIANEKIQSIDKIILENESQKRGHLQRTIEIIGLMLAVIIGLPSIYDTVFFIREYFNFICIDIPVVSVKNFSLLIWLLLIAWLIWMICKSRSLKNKNN